MQYSPIKRASIKSAVCVLTLAGVFFVANLIDGLQLSFFIDSVAALVVPLFVYGFVFFERQQSGKNQASSILYATALAIATWFLAMSLLALTPFVCESWECIGLLGVSVSGLLGMNVLIPIVMAVEQKLSRSTPSRVEASDVGGMASLTISRGPVLVSAVVIAALLGVVLIRFQDKREKAATLDAYEQQQQSYRPDLTSSSNVGTGKYVIEPNAIFPSMLVSLIVNVATDCVLVITDGHGAQLGSSAAPTGEHLIDVVLSRTTIEGETVTAQLYEDGNKNGIFDSTDKQIEYSESADVGARRDLVVGP